MRRRPKTHKKLPMKKKDEPDFYKLNQTNPLPEVHEAPVPGAAATVQAMRSGPGTPTNCAGNVGGPTTHMSGGGGMISGSSSSIVTPNISPYHQQNIIGLGPHQNHSGMMGGNGGVSPRGSMNSGMNAGYMGGGGNGVNSMNFMNGGGMVSGSGMMNGNFGHQGSMGMMGGGPMGNMANMGGGMSGPMSNNTSGIGSMGSNGGMSNMGPRGGNGGNSRFNNYNDIDEYEMPMMGAQQHQMAYSPMGQANSSVNYGNGGGYMGSGGNVGGASYSNMSTPISGHNNGGSSTMRRNIALRQQGIENQHHGMGEMQPMPQQFMNDMYIPQGSMQDMMPQQHHHSQHHLYGGRPINGGGGASPSMSQQHQQQHQPQDDYRGSGSPSVMQQHRRRSSPTRVTP